MKTLLKLSLITTLGLGQLAYAQHSTHPAGQKIQAIMGTQDAIDATPRCDVDLMGGDAGGSLAAINMVPCLLNLQAGVTGPTGAAGVTKTLTFDGYSFKAHIVVLDTPVTVDGKTYDYEAKIWTCDTNCNATTDFFPAIWMAFSANATKSVNKGVLVNNFDADTGNFIGASFIRWDTGSATTTRNIESVQGECRSDGSFDSRFMKYTREVSTGITKYAMREGDNTAEAYTLLIELNTKTNIGSVNENGSGADPFERKAATLVFDGANRSDYTYTATGTYTPSFLTLPTFNANSFTAVACTGGAISAGNTNGTITELGKGVGLLASPLAQPMNGMTLNPSNI